MVERVISKSSEKKHRLRVTRPWLVIALLGVVTLLGCVGPEKVTPTAVATASATATRATITQVVLPTSTPTSPPTERPTVPPTLTPTTTRLKIHEPVRVGGQGSSTLERMKKFYDEQRERFLRIFPSERWSFDFTMAKGNMRSDFQLAQIQSGEGLRPCPGAVLNMTAFNDQLDLVPVSTLVTTQRTIDRAIWQQCPGIPIFRALHIPTRRGEDFARQDKVANIELEKDARRTGVCPFDPQVGPLTGPDGQLKEEYADGDIHLGTDGTEIFLKMMRAPLESYVFEGVCP